MIVADILYSDIKNHHHYCLLTVTNVDSQVDREKARNTNGKNNQ